MIVLFCAAAAAVAGCAQTEGVMYSFEDAKLPAATDLFDVKVPEWAKRGDDGTSFDLGPKGPVAAENLISPTGYCPPAAEVPNSPAQAAQAAAPKPVQAAAAPPPDRLEPAGATPAMPQAPVLGGVTLGMSECTVARRLGSPSNVSISAGPKGQRRVVLTYAQGERPGLYSFQSGRLIQIDATPQQAAKFDKNARKKSRRSRREVQRMYVQ